MHYVLHVIHPADVDVTDYITEKMAPYYEELEVPEYKEYYSDKELAKIKEWYTKEAFHEGDDPNDIVPFSWNHSQCYVDDQGVYRLSTFNPQGHWDWWTIGGRWDNYWEIEGESAPVKDTVNTVSVGYALSLKDQGKYEWMANGPYAYMTLDGDFVARQNYNKDGEGYENDDPNSVFPPNPDYDYWGYLTSVEPIENVAITIVDYHC